MTKKSSNLAELREFVQSNKNSVCYISSDDPFYIDEAIKEIKSKKLDESFRDFNFDLFYGRETPATQILSIIKTQPFMSSLNRLVIVKQANQLRESDWKTLKPVLENPVSFCFLAFTGQKPDQRKKTIKSAMKTMTHFNFIKPYEGNMGKWSQLIRHFCKKNSLQIRDEGIHLLFQMVGPHLLDLQNEVLKLAQYAGEKKNISLEDIKKVTSKIKPESLFNLTSFIGKQDGPNALLCLSELLEEKETEVGILSMIHRHIRLLRQVIIGRKQGLQGGELAGFSGVHPYYLKDYLSQTQFWNEAKIEDTYQLLCKTDRAIKSSATSSSIFLENLILKACNL